MKNILTPWLQFAVMALPLLLAGLPASSAQLSIGIGLPSLSIGINVPLYPQLVQVPNYPVYYAPRMASNYFFYDGLYWVYQDDGWYASTWYDGPWQQVAHAAVPLFVLRIPVRYYRSPPDYFRGWRSDAPPRWGEHWGPAWQRERRGWDQWDRRATYAPAPLPYYQRAYSADRYPQPAQQQQLRSQYYRHQPRDSMAQQQFRQQPMPQYQPPSQATAPRRDPGEILRGRPVPPPASEPELRPRREFPPPADARPPSRPQPQLPPQLQAPPQASPQLPPRAQPQPRPDPQARSERDPRAHDSVQSRRAQLGPNADEHRQRAGKPEVNDGKRENKRERGQDKEREQSGERGK